MNKKKLTLIIMILILSVSMANLWLSAYHLGSESLLDYNQTYHISTESNFFGQPENQTPVSLPDDYEFELALKGFDFVSETESLKLYIKERNFNIAVYDKASGYLWYSVYPDYNQFMLSGTSKFFVESGVVIEYYNMDNILVDDSKSYLSGPKYNVSCEYDYESEDNGVRAHLNFEDLAIQFDVVVKIDGSNLIVHLPMDSLVEEDIEKTMLNIDGTTYQKITSYRLKAVYLFPYFGSNNYEINGYSFIPDGSGALIRYTDVRSSTAYTKRLYGADEGVLKYNPNASSYYIQDELTASLPVFGVNHGYRQAAFLAIITEGDAYTELHSYPYGYNSYLMNTTFAKFIVRERYTIQTSSNEADSFQMINSTPYPTDYTIEYHFLSNQDASYSGMANEYRTALGIDKTASPNGTNITLIGMDFKNGLFGKNYVEMTRYSDVSDIVTELKDASLEQIDVLYMAWSKGGYYDNTPVKPVVAANLGGKSDFNDMMAFLEQQGVDIAFFNNPIISFDQNLGSKVIKKLTLSNFATNDVKTSLFGTTYYTDPQSVAEVILNEADRYEKLNMDQFVFASLGDSLFSYRYNSTNYYRNQTIAILEAEMEALGDYQIGLYKPNAYLWKYINAYYDAPIESNKYAYISDSIPFIELVLNGSANLYSSYINYVSDYDLMSLRLIEYGVCPSYLLTKESTHNLRYTNSEYIYTSEFALWKDTIVAINETVMDPLSAISQSQMLSHRYVLDGVAEVVYANGTTIYVNYNNEEIDIDPLTTVPAYSYKVVNSG